MPPAKPVAGTGIRSSMSYGPVCPQGVRAGWKNDEEAFMFEWDDGYPSEDCLRVNVWTPGVDKRKRPVTVWIHGGGFSVQPPKRPAKQGGAPVFMYLFAWRTTVLDGRPRAFHCSQLPFCFNNIDGAAAMTGGTEEARTWQACFRCMGQLCS